MLMNSKEDTPATWMIMARELVTIALRAALPVLHRLRLHLRRRVRVIGLLRLLLVTLRDLLLAVQGLAQLLVTRTTTCPKR